MGRTNNKKKTVNRSAWKPFPSFFYQNGATVTKLNQKLVLKKKIITGEQKHCKYTSATWAWGCEDSPLLQQRWGQSVRLSIKTNTYFSVSSSRTYIAKFNWNRCQSTELLKGWSLFDRRKEWSESTFLNKIKESWSEKKLPIALFTMDYNSTKIHILHEMVSFAHILVVLKVTEKSDNVGKRYCIKPEPHGTSILKAFLIFIFFIWYCSIKRVKTEISYFYFYGIFISLFFNLFMDNFKVQPFDSKSEKLQGKKRLMKWTSFNLQTKSNFYTTFCS